MQFRINALDDKQSVVTLELSAASESAAVDTARRQGLTVLSVKPRGLGFSATARKTRFPLALFSVELMSLLDAGLNLVEAMQALSEKEGGREKAGERHRVVAGLLAAIRRGESFSQ